MTPGRASLAGEGLEGNVPRLDNMGRHMRWPVHHQLDQRIIGAPTVLTLVWPFPRVRPLVLPEYLGEAEAFAAVRARVRALAGVYEQVTSEILCAVKEPLAMGALVISWSLLVGMVMVCNGGVALLVGLAVCLSRANTQQNCLTAGIEKSLIYVL